MQADDSTTPSSVKSFDLELLKLEAELVRANAIMEQNQQVFKTTSDPDIKADSSIILELNNRYRELVEDKINLARLKAGTASNLVGGYELDFRGIEPGLPRETARRKSFSVISRHSRPLSFPGKKLSKPLHHSAKKSSSGSNSGTPLG